MLFPINKNSIIFILIIMWSKADKIDTFMRLIPPLHSIDCRDISNETIPVDIQSRNQLFRLTDLLNGSVKIDFDSIPYDHVLLTFASDRSNENAATSEIDCWSTVNDSIIVSELFESETQMFCLMEKEAKTVSPLDCLSISPKSSASDNDSVWLTEDDKSLAIGLLVMGLILCMVLGFTIGILIVKRQANKKKINKNESASSRPDLIGSDWKRETRNDGFDYPYTDDDTISVASDNYVPAVNPSRFDVIKMSLEKSENAGPNQSENLYGLEVMPSSKAPTLPENFRDSGISTGPIYAISTKVKDCNDHSDGNAENLYLCVDHDITSDSIKKNE